MTIIDPTTTVSTGQIALRPIAFDLYRDIHKGIRSELFSLVETAGRSDASRRDERLVLAEKVRDMVWILVSHAEHEDGHIQPIIEEHLPHIADKVVGDHHHLDGRIQDLLAMADDAVDAPAGTVRQDLHRLYVELASFTSAYLQHQDLEERVIMPALEDALGVEAVIGVHEALVGDISPEDMARSLAFMLPAMNVDDRTELLDGIRAGAPAEAFAGVWGLAGSVLTPAEHAAVAIRLGLS